MAKATQTYTAYFSKEINPEPDSNSSMNKTVLASSFLTRHLKYIFYMHIKQIPKENVIPKIYKSKIDIAVT